ncbi:MAG: tetratricopeptide (TPR) repeat protein [Acidimicrobiales bacterium]
MTAKTKSGTTKQSAAQKTLQAPPIEPGAALYEEALELLEARKWKAAVQVLQALRRLRPDDSDVDELLLVAASHGKVTAEREAAIRRLTNGTTVASSWTAIAASHLAANNFAEADRAARQAIELDPESPGGWRALGTSFAGLGWFDEAADCLERVEDDATNFEQWQLGRAVNAWAMSMKHAIVFSAITVLLFRLLGAALVVTAPLLLREVRVSRLDEPFRSVADGVWAHEHRLKIMRGTLVLLIVASWAALVLAVS